MKYKLTLDDINIDYVPTSHNEYFGIKAVLEIPIKEYCILRESIYILFELEGFDFEMYVYDQEYLEDIVRIYLVSRLTFLSCLNKNEKKGALSKPLTIT